MSDICFYKIRKNRLVIDIVDDEWIVSNLSDDGMDNFHILFFLFFLVMILGQYTF